MKAPLLSVTVSNRNYGRFLDQNIESILSQSFDDYEIILIDNASSDGSLEVMRKYEATDCRVRVIAHEKDEGLFASLRESCDTARGRYRVHVDADDWILDPRAFETQLDMLEAHPTIAFVYSAMTMTDPVGNVVHISHPHHRDVVLPGEIAVEDVLSFNVMNTGMMLRLDSYRSTAGYPTQYPHVADMLLAVRLCEVGDVGYIDKPLYAFRQHGTNLHLQPQREVLRQEILPVIDTAFTGSLGPRIPNRRAVHRRVIRRATVQLPTHYVFVSQPRMGWILYWESVKVAPFATVFQRRSLSLIAMTVLGQRRYGWLRRRLGRLPDTSLLAPSAGVEDIADSR